MLDSGPDDAAEPPPTPPPAPVPEDWAEYPSRRRYPSTLGGAFYIAVLIVAGVALALMLLGGDWRVAVRLLAGSLAAAGVLRGCLPEHEAGMLAVRRRWIDVVLLLAVAGVLWWLAGSIPDQPS